MIKVECVQGMPEWVQNRVGVITASRFRDACDRLKTGKPSAKSIAYAAQLAIERVSEAPSEDGFVTYAMRRGTELEPQARLEYEFVTGNFASESGIVLTDDRLFGYSTDGEVGDDGLIEIKCILSPEKLIAIWRDEDVSEYIHQVMGGMWLTGRKWVDLIVYAPQLEKIGKQLFVKRIERNDAFIEKLERDLIEFERFVSETEAILRKQSA